MRLLIYGMQSSGASTLAFLLGQLPGCSAFPDIWAMYIAPSLPGSEDVVAKVVVTTAYPLSIHQERFCPDRTILLLRHPVPTYRSLAKRAYKNHCGFPEEKFAILDQAFLGRNAFDAVLYYEDLVFSPLTVLATVRSVGWPCDENVLLLARDEADIRSTNDERYPWLSERLQYGVGKYRGGRLVQTFADLGNLCDQADQLRDWCPNIMQHYDTLLRENGRVWGIEQTSAQDSHRDSNAAARKGFC